MLAATLTVPCYYPAEAARLAKSKRRRRQNTIEEDWLFPLPARRSKDEGELRGHGLPVEKLWTASKARLIAHYLYLFVQVTRHGTYLDGFAGPQDQDTNWAARLVLETNLIRHFYLFDKSPKQVRALKKLKLEHPDRHIEVVLGDFNQEVGRVLREDKISAREATFCLLDQRTFECQWATVERIARFRSKGYKIETFYFFANSWLDRAMSAVQSDAAARWWGGPEWTKLRKMHSVARAQLVADRFRDCLGYASAKPWAIYENRASSKVMYYMIHATDHPAAPDLMRRAYEEAVRVEPTYDQLNLSPINSKRVVPSASHPTLDHPVPGLQP